MEEARAKAERHLRRLLDQKRRLQERLENLDFAMDELAMEKTCMEEMAEQNEVIEPESIFEYLTLIESQEARIRHEIRENDVRKQNLSHYRHVCTNRNKELERKLSSESTKLDRLETENRALDDEIKDLEEKINNGKILHAELTTACEALESELAEKENEPSTEAEIARLKAKLIRKQEKLETRRKQLADTELELDRGERAAEARTKQEKAEIQKLESVKNWEAERRLLAKKMKEEKQKLLSTLSNLDVSRKRDQALSEKIREIAGSDDPGDGTGLRARQMLQAEIESFDERDLPPESEVISLENDYNEELEEQMRILEASKTTLRAYRQQVLSDLQEELQNSLQAGYLALLQADLDAVKHTVAWR